MDTPAPKRRWFQFSLRTLLVFVTLCAIACSWLAVKLRQADRQRKAVEEIRKLGGDVYYDWQVDAKFNPVANPIPTGLFWLRSVLGENFFWQVKVVVFSNPQVTDAVLENLKGLSQLQMLSLDRTQLTDAGLENLKGLSQLQILSLGCTQLTDVGLENLKGLSQLQMLSLERTQLTDAGLENLKGLSKLQILDLALTQVTDAGLENLKGLSQLQELDLKGTKVTDEGVKKLQQALPNCKIER